MSPIMGGREAQSAECHSWNWQQQVSLGFSPKLPDPSSSRGLLFLLVSTRMEDGVFSQQLLAEKANIQKYFDNDILQFPEAV